jgi:hypothetical protein
MAYPEYGTSPIECGARKCQWRGYETDLKKVQDKGGTGSVIVTSRNLCPECGNDSYSFMSAKDAKAWLQSRPVVCTCGKTHPDYCPVHAA